MKNREVPLKKTAIYNNRKSQNVKKKNINEQVEYKNLSRKDKSSILIRENNLVEVVNRFSMLNTKGVNNDIEYDEIVSGEILRKIDNSKKITKESKRIDSMLKIMIYLNINKNRKKEDSINERIERQRLDKTESVQKMKGKYAE